MKCPKCKKGEIYSVNVYHPRQKKANIKNGFVLGKCYGVDSIDPTGFGLAFMSIESGCGNIVKLPVTKYGKWDWKNKETK